MADTIFDIAAESLEGHTDMDRLAVRGTLRIAVKEAGLYPEKLTLPQLRVIFEKLMPKELEARGVSDAAAVCTATMDEIARSANTIDTESSASPDDIFKRLGGS
jgi:hypothetical protein